MRGLSEAETLTAKLGLVCSSNSENAAPADENMVFEAHAHVSSGTTDVAAVV